jgi:hypothetical protein
MTRCHDIFFMPWKPCILIKKISWIKLLFENTTAAVNLNGSPGNNSKIERGVRQGCPLAPNLFIIVGEVLIYIIKKAVAEKNWGEFIFREGRNNNVFVNTRMTCLLWLEGRKKMWMNLWDSSQFFSKLSGMKINWDKSCAYWLTNSNISPYDFKGMIDNGR